MASRTDPGAGFTAISTRPRTGSARHAGGAKATSHMIASRTAASPLPSSRLDLTQSPFQTSIALAFDPATAAWTSGSFLSAFSSRRGMSHGRPAGLEPAVAAPAICASLSPEPASAAGLATAAGESICGAGDTLRPRWRWRLDGGCRDGQRRRLARRPPIDQGLHLHRRDRRLGGTASGAAETSARTTTRWPARLSAAPSHRSVASPDGRPAWAWMAWPILRSPAHRKFQNPPEDFGIPT